VHVRARCRYGGLKPFFAALDTNSDSVVDFDEFARGIKTLQVEHLFPRSLQRRVFAHIDTNSSGTIELSEMQAFLASAANSHSGEELDLASAAAAASTITAPNAAAATAAADQHSVLQEAHAATAAATAAADRAQMLRAKAALVYALNRTVPNAAANPLFDNKTAFLRKQV
jgi:EF hand